VADQCEDDRQSRILFTEGTGLRVAPSGSSKRPAAYRIARAHCLETQDRHPRDYSAQDNGDMNQLDALKQFTTVVADTGDFRQLAQF
jgi:hypothetical protein